MQAKRKLKWQHNKKLQSDLTAAVQAKDEKKIEEAIKTFNKTVEDTIASLDKLDITAPS